MFHFRSIVSDPAQEVDRLLQEARRASGSGPRRVVVLADGPGFELRQITLMACEELPFRRNYEQAKVWRVVAGRGHADIDEGEIAMMPAAEVEIGAGVLHQIENRGSEPLVLQELRVLGDLDAAARAEANRAMDTHAGAAVLA